jgi:mRNA interferase RelE/StbE
MKVEFKRSFTRDLRKIENKDLLERARKTIEQVEQVQSLQEIRSVKKLRGGDNYYRIRIGDYRLGLVVEGDTVVFVRLLHRKDVYRYFP